MLRLVSVVARKIVALVGWVQLPYLNPNTLVMEFGRHVGLRNQYQRWCASSNLARGTVYFPRVVMDSISTYEVDGKNSTLFEEA